MKTIPARCLLTVALVLFTSLCTAVFAIEITVKAGAFPRKHTLVTFEFDEFDPSKSYRAKDTHSGVAADCQSNGTELCFLLPELIQAGASRTFQVEETSMKNEPTDTKAIENEESVHFSRNDHPVATYHKAVQSPPPGVDKFYRRSGFIHPVTTPQGNILTDPFPADHLHQHALFSAWVKCDFLGHPVDFWNQKKELGTVEHRAVKMVESGPVFAGSEFELVYVDLSQQDPIDVLQENWQLRLFSHPQHHLFEITSVQQSISDSPLMVREYKYGGMAFRGNGQWRDGNAKFLTSDGKTRLDGNRTRPNWVSLYGVVDGAKCGIAIFSHPDNFRSPQPVRLHPSMPYFVFSPPVLGDFQISPNDEPLRNRYLYYAFDGEPDVKELSSLWHDYASPPKVVVVK